LGKKSNRRQIEWHPAPDIRKKIASLAQKLQLKWLKTRNIFCVRSQGANTRAIARIWGLSRIWQIALGEEPKYIIEVVSERYDRLGELEKDKVLLHEIAHIPLNFSGSLVPHIRQGKRRFSSKVDILVAQYLKSK
jgi:predicted metallopeptidase